MIKQEQLDIFGGGESKPHDAPTEVKKPKRKRRRSSKGREVKKAPMLVDAYDAGVSSGSKGVRENRVEAKVKTEAKVEVEAKVKAKVEAQAQEEKGPHIFTVGELTDNVKQLLETAYAEVWVTGEVTDFKNRTGRHYYFSLKDDRSKIRIVIFGAGSRRFPFDIEDGLELICHGKLNVYAPRGEYSIVVDHCEPKGKGALQLAFEQLKKKLEAEGLFSRERKKSIPYLPRKIGVVTSPTGAAVRDIIHVLTRRFPNIEVLIHPAKVQGEGSAEEVAEAIASMNRRSDLDVLIVGRGGGSIEDLWTFNEEVVARAIAASRIPIISAVGHEIDFTIADFVADVRAPTPSAAAEIAVPVRAELMETLKNRQRQMAYALVQGLDRRYQDVKRLAGRLGDPGRRLPDLMRHVDALRQRIVFVMKADMERRGHLLVKFASNMEHLSPLGVLAKGYSVVEDFSGKVIKSSKSIKMGDSLKLRFHQGGASTKVIKIID